MKKRICAAMLVMGSLMSFALLAESNPWTKVSSKKNLTIFNRNRAGSSIKEVKAVGNLNCEPWVCKNVVDRVDRYPGFMPYTEIARIIKTTNTHLVSYQYLDMPFISDRDYTIKIYDRSYRQKNGTVIYKKIWSPANHLGPAKKDGVVRLVTNEGFWQFEPLDGGKRTRGTYYLYTDPGGALPAFIINKANTSALPKLFKAVEKAAQEPFYQTFRPQEPPLEPVAQPATIRPSTEPLESTR